MADNQSNQVEDVAEETPEEIATAQVDDTDAPSETPEVAAESPEEVAAEAAEDAPVEAEPAPESSTPESSTEPEAEEATTEASAAVAATDEASAEVAATDEASAAEAPAEDASAEEELADATEEAAGPQAVEEEADAVEASSADGPDKTGGDGAGGGYMGFTGEIRGKVITLAELESREPEELNKRPIELERLYEATLTSVQENDIVPGRIVSIGEKDVVIDIGFKSDGIVAKNEFDGEIETGQTVEVYLERLEDRQGQLVLSKRHADELRRWQRIEDAYENDTIVEGEIVNRIKGGMVVDLFGTEAFLPGSQIDIRPVRDFDAYLGKRMEFKVVKLNPVNGNVVVSHKALIEKDLEEQRRKILDKMEPGQVLEGVVKNITDFGVFIDLGGVDGLLHITDLSWGRVSHPSEMVDLDEKLNVVVLDYDKERQRISLGLKQLQSHPWENIEERFAENQTVEGKVVSITDYGAFVELEKGIEGLVHISEMSWTQHIRHPSEVVQLGTIIPVKILRIDSENRKISLGMKQLQPDPWEKLAERQPPGTVARGIVRNITNFGVFVELEPGVDGLVHISDLSWTKKIRHPSEVVKKGQELDVMVLDIDIENRRLSLGHKQVETNPWNQFSVAYAEGTDTTAKVARFEDSGIVVDLPLEVEAFVPASHLLRDRHQEAYNVGDDLELRVIDFDASNRKIVLSEKRRVEEVETQRRRAEDSERRERRSRERREVDSFKREQRGGPATIGELSGLAELKAKMEQAEAAEKSAKKTKAKVKAPKAEDETEVFEAAESVEAMAPETAEAEAAEKSAKKTKAKVKAPKAEDETEVSEAAESVEAEAPETAEPEAEADVEAVAEDTAEAEAEADVEAVAEDTEAVEAEDETEVSEAAESVEAEAPETAEPEAEADVEAVAEDTAEAEAEADVEAVAEDTAEAEAEAESEEDKNS